jgi:imidazolonepropionase-like amidohydrolase
LSNVLVWDGIEEIGPHTVSYDGEAITDITPSTAAIPPEMSVIPGLIDTHVHLTGPARPGNYTYGTWPLITTDAEQALHAAAHAQAALRMGVTTVRDMASDQRPVALRRCFDAGLLQGPRVLAYGVVNMTAGHQDLFTPPDAKVRPPTADGPDACRALVRWYARAGVDGIKVMTGGGVLSTGDKAGWRNYTAAELDAIVDEAHALSLPVAAHAHTEAAIDAALAAGVDSIEHGTLITADQAAEIARRGITVAPTLVINDGIADGTVPADDDARAKARELVSDRDGRLHRAAAAGVRFVLGTDTNGSMLPWGTAFRELQAMAATLGYTAETSLAAATSTAAAAIGRGDRLGRIEVGYAPDLLLVRGRPWRDLGQLSPDNLVAVICRGRLAHGEIPQ